MSVEWKRFLSGTVFFADCLCSAALAWGRHTEGLCMKTFLHRLFSMRRDNLKEKGYEAESQHFNLSPGFSPNAVCWRKIETIDLYYCLRIYRYHCINILLR